MLCRFQGRFARGLLSVLAQDLELLQVMVVDVVNVGVLNLLHDLLIELVFVD